MTDWNDLSDAELDTLALVERSLPPVTPSADLFARILDEVKPEAKVIPLDPPTARTRRMPRVTLVATLAAAAVLVLGLLVLRGFDPTPTDARAAIAGKSDPAVSGVAELHGSHADGGTMHLELRDVPPAPGGHHYEVWVLRKGGTNMESVGSFTPTSSSVRLDLSLPGPGDYAAVDVSVEDDGGTPAHSETSLASGTFSEG